MCIAAALSANQVIGARLLSGLCLGIQQVTMTVYISETIQTHLRPKLKLIPAISMMTGITLKMLEHFLFNDLPYYTNIHHVHDVCTR